MSSYAQLADLRAYAPGIASLSDSALQSLLDNAERDLDDLVLPPTSLSASRQMLSSTATAGTFVLAFTWLGQVYETVACDFDISADELVSNLNHAVNVYGMMLPQTTVWEIAPNPPYGAFYPRGPLHTLPIVVQATGNMAEQALDLLDVHSSLTGGALTVTSIVEGGKKADPTLLEPFQQQALMRATCAQAQYRNVMGDSFFIRAQYEDVSGPVFHTSGKLPLIGPAVRRELMQSGMTLFGARAAVGSSHRTGVGFGWPAYPAVRPRW